MKILLHREENFTPSKRKSIQYLKKFVVNSVVNKN